jgi:hypothetical protein
MVVLDDVPHVDQELGLAADAGLLQDAHVATVAFAASLLADLGVRNFRLSRI